jgi:hypothetical protein
LPERVDRTAILVYACRITVAVRLPHPRRRAHALCRTQTDEKHHHLGSRAGHDSDGEPAGRPAQAKALFKAMSDYLSAQQTLSYEYDTTLEIVTNEKQKLGLASSGSVTLHRPDKIRATRSGGFAQSVL